MFACAILQNITRVKYSAAASSLSLHSRPLTICKPKIGTVQHFCSLDKRKCGTVPIFWSPGKQKIGTVQHFCSLDRRKCCTVPIFCLQAPIKCHTVPKKPKKPIVWELPRAPGLVVPERLVFLGFLGTVQHFIGTCKPKIGTVTALLQSGQAKVLYCLYFLVPRQAKNRDSTALLPSRQAKVLYCPYFLLAGTNKVPYCP